jgi:hypothetical protein
MMLVSHIVDTDPAKALDAVIYLMDPVDPSSNVPKALALKRQCAFTANRFCRHLLAPAGGWNSKRWPPTQHPIRRLAQLRAEVARLKRWGAIF